MSRRAVRGGVISVVVMLLAAGGVPATAELRRGDEPRLGEAVMAMGDIPARASGCPEEDVGVACDEVDEQDPTWTGSVATAPSTSGAGITTHGGMVVSPGGDRVVIGTDKLFGAYDAATGDQIWETTLSSGGFSRPSGPDLAFSPDGTRVYAAGSRPPEDLHGANDSFDFIVAAYDAATGAELWQHVTGLPGLDANTDRYQSVERARAIAVSPDGRRVYVTGTTQLRDRILGGSSATGGRIVEEDVLVVAHDAASGQRRWTRQFGAKLEHFEGDFIAVSPDSTRLYVGGLYKACQVGCVDHAFLAIGMRAYHPGAPAREGEVLWESRDHGLHGEEELRAMELSADGSLLYLMGKSEGETATGSDWDWATLAYRADTGEEAWSSRYQGSETLLSDLHDDFSVTDLAHDPTSMAVSPAGDKVFVTGKTAAFAWTQEVPEKPPGVPAWPDDVVLHYSALATVVYDAVTGEQQDEWGMQPGLPPAVMTSLGAEGAGGSGSGAPAVVVSPDGEVAYVVGYFSDVTTSQAPGGPIEERWEQVTIAYDIGTGDWNWVHRLPDSRATAWAEVSPGGTSLFTLLADRSLRRYEVTP